MKNTIRTKSNKTLQLKAETIRLLDSVKLSFVVAGTENTIGNLESGCTSCKTQ